MVRLEHTYAFEGLGHDLWPVIDGQHDIRNAGAGKGLNLVLNHGLVGELDERLRVGKGLHMVSP